METIHSLHFTRDDIESLHSAYCRLDDLDDILSEFKHGHKTVKIEILGREGEVVDDIEQNEIIRMRVIFDCLANGSDFRFNIITEGEENK